MESNHRHRDFQSLALPTELTRHIFINLSPVEQMVTHFLFNRQKPKTFVSLRNLSATFFIISAELFKSRVSLQIFRFRKSPKYYCGPRYNVTFLPSSIGFFSITSGSFFKSSRNLFAKSKARFECCISRPLIIITTFTLLP